MRCKKSGAKQTNILTSARHKAQHRWPPDPGIEPNVQWPHVGPPSGDRANSHNPTGNRVSGKKVNPDREPRR